MINCKESKKTFFYALFMSTINEIIMRFYKKKNCMFTYF